MPSTKTFLLEVVKVGDHPEGFLVESRKVSHSSNFTRYSVSYALDRNLVLLPPSEVPVSLIKRDSNFYAYSSLVYVAEQFCRYHAGDLVSSVIRLYKPDNLEHRNLVCQDVTHVFSKGVRESLATIYLPFVISRFTLG